jgi:hypothetical protein
MSTGLTGQEVLGHVSCNAGAEPGTAPIYARLEANVGFDLPLGEEEKDCCSSDASAISKAICGELIAELENPVSAMSLASPNVDGAHAATHSCSRAF